MKIFAIIVTYNGMKWYERCLGNLRDSCMAVETIVIDNASTDGSVPYIREHFPMVHLVESKENLGFAKANNIGMRYAIDHGADYVFLLNEDAWIEKDTLTTLIKTFEDNEHVGIASPIHLNGSYSDMDERFCQWLPKTMISDLYLNKLKKYYESPYVNAAAWLISAECIKTIGGFDTSIFVHYGEDDNYCQRLKYHKLKLIVNTSCTICHDRELRDPNNDDNRKCWKETIRREELAERWSNINVEYPFDKIIRHLNFNRILALACLQTERAKKIQEQTEICKAVISSRKINKEIGMHWL